MDQPELQKKKNTRALFMIKRNRVECALWLFVMCFMTFCHEYHHCVSVAQQINNHMELNQIPRFFFSKLMLPIWIPQKINRYYSFSSALALKSVYHILQFGCDICSFRLNASVFSMANFFGEGFPPHFDSYLLGRLLTVTRSIQAR